MSQYDLLVVLVIDSRDDQPKHPSLGLRSRPRGAARF